MFFFKSKPTLASLIPHDFVDIHSHILPGIDDGSKSSSESNVLLKAMNKLGFIQCIATPHTLAGVWNNTNQTINDSLEICRKELEISQNKMLVKAASEYMLDQTFLHRIQNETLLTLKDNFVLVEMSYQSPPLALFDIIFELQLKGYQPILAHPERYIFYHKDIKKLEKIKQTRCLFQVNLLSTVGYYGDDVAKISQKLIDAEMIDFAGSDVHHLRHIDAFQMKLKINKPEALEKILAKNTFFKY